MGRLDNRTGNLVTQLPYFALRDVEGVGVMHTTNGSYEIGVEVTMPNSLFSGMPPILETFRHLLHTALPAHSRLRLISEVAPARKDILEGYKSRITAPEQGLRTLLDSRVQQYEEDWEKGLLRSYRTFCTVRLGTPSRRPFRGLSPHRLNMREREVLAISEQLMLTLQRADFKPQLMAANDLYQLCFRYFNPDLVQTPLSNYQDLHHYFPKKAVEKLDGLRPSSIRAQLAKTPINNGALGHLIIGSKFAKLFALHTLPGKETYAGMIHATEAAGAHYSVITDIYIEPAHKAMGHIAARARQYESAASGGDFYVYVDPETRQLNRETDAALLHSYDTGDRFFKMSVGLILYDDTLRGLKRRATETYAALAAIPGNPFMPLTHGCLTPYLNFAPLGGRDHKQKVTLTTSNATHFLPVSGPWAGTEKPVALYRNRYFGTTKVDPFDPGANAYNGIVIGETGSGKTFIMQHLLSEFLSDATTQVVIIDRGSGYRPLVEATEGAVVELKVGGKTSINPFDLAPGQFEPSDEEKMLLLNILRAMIPSEGSATKDVEDAILMAAITQLYSYAYKRIHHQATFVTPTLSDFAKKLEQLDEVNTFHMQNEHRLLAKNLAMRLQFWLGDTALGSFVDRATNIPLSSARVVLYDTEGLRSHEELKAVGTLMISQLVWKRVSANSRQRTLVILDEGWAMVQNNKAGQQFIDELFRRFRKTGSGIWAMSQSYADFLTMPGIIHNVQNFLFLKSDAAERDLWKRSLNLPQAVIDLAEKVNNAKYQFSEALYLVKRGETFQGNLIALHPTPLDHLTFTTNAVDTAKREELLAQYGTLQEAVKHLEVA
ncbi:MAG: VirB4 family type IV secretion system protein [Trueperaceae bacterium]